MKQFVLKTCKIIQWLTIVVGLSAAILPIVFWKSIPEEVPSHYNGRGVADAWGGKEIIVLLMFLSVILLGMMSIAAYVVKSDGTSKYTNIDGKEGYPYRYALIVWMNFGLEAFFAYVIYACATARTHLGTWIFSMFLVVFFIPIVGLIIVQSRARKKTQKGLQIAQEKVEKGQVWRSRVDLWLALLLLGCLGWMLYAVIMEWIREREVSYVLVVTFLILAAIILPLFNIRYIFYKDYLKVDCGIYGTERIPYGSIVSIKKTMNPLSSAALSLRRLEILYEIEGISKMVLISPKNRDAFMKEVEKRKDV